MGRELSDPRPGATNCIARSAYTPTDSPADRWAGLGPDGGLRVVVFSASVQSAHESRELRGRGGSQPLEPLLLLRQRRKRLPEEPVKLGQLILAARLPAKGHHPQRRVDPTKRVLKMLLTRPRRRTRNPEIAVIATPPLLTGAIPLMSTAVTSTLRHKLSQRAGQVPTKPGSQSIPPTTHRNHDIPLTAAYACLATHGTSPHADSDGAPQTEGSYREPGGQPPRR
jgi:hypothetical protein